MKRLVSAAQLKQEKLFTIHYKNLDEFFHDFNKPLIMDRISQCIYNTVTNNSLIDSFAEGLGSSKSTNIGKIKTIINNPLLFLKRHSLLQNVLDELYHVSDIDNQEVSEKLGAQLLDAWKKESSSSFKERYQTDIINVYMEKCKNKINTENIIDYFGKFMIYLQKHNSRLLIDKINDCIQSYVPDEKFKDFIISNCTSEEIQHLFSCGYLEMQTRRDVTIVLSFFHKTFKDVLIAVLSDYLNKQNILLSNISVETIIETYCDANTLGSYYSQYQYVWNILNGFCKKHHNKICALFKNIPNIEIHPRLIQNCNDLSEINDTINDIYTVDTGSRLDINERERPFVYLDGDVAWGHKGSSHSETINNYSETHHKRHLSENKFRVSDSELESATDYNDIAFGHYAQGIAIVENNMFGNANIDTVNNSLRKDNNECTVDKVYLYNVNGRTLKRISRLQKNRGK